MNIRTKHMHDGSEFAGVRAILAQILELDQGGRFEVNRRTDLMSTLFDWALASTASEAEELQLRMGEVASKGPVLGLSMEFFAAHLALRREQFELAGRHCASGRALAKSLAWEPELASFCLIEGTIAHKLGLYAEAQRHFEEAIVAARRAGISELELRAEMNLGLVLKNLGNLEGSERLLRGSLEGARLGSAIAFRARCALNLTTVLVRRGKWAEAELVAGAAESDFAALGLAGFENTARLVRGRVLRLRGSLDEARTVLLSCLDGARSMERPRNVILALEFLSECETDSDNPPAAREYAAEALVLARGLAAGSDLVLECCRALGSAECVSGNLIRARALAEESVELARTQGDLFELGHSLLLLARVHVRLGELDAGASCLHEARSLAGRIGDPYCRGLASLALSDLAGRKSDRVAVLALLGEAKLLFDEVGAGDQSGVAAKRIGLLTDDASGSPTTLGETSNVQELTELAKKATSVSGFLTVDPRVRKTLATVKTLAPQTLNILILGESGTGKELIAQAVHEESGRKGPFVPVNCSAFPGDLIEGELFGHARGAYTGADRERVGLFEFANKGTLFLDEIGDMPVKAQARLLRALESGEVRRLGENTSRTVDVRIVAATHRHLLEMVGAGEFRLDLYYRLAGYVVDLPPIRERTDDARLLVDHYLQRFAKEQDKSITLTPELRQELASHSWPGNVREIRLMMQRLVSLTPSGTIVRKLPFVLEGDPRPRTLPEVLEAEEKKRILDALQAHNWNKARAAITLGTNRTTLIGKMKRMGIALGKR